jgi:hypothetical protein
MACLLRIVNGGGTVTREYALGRKRIDLCVEFAGESFAFELKMAKAQPLQKSKNQIHGYLTRLGLAEGYLVLFTKPQEVQNWDHIGTIETIIHEGKTIHLMWM